MANIYQNITGSAATKLGETRNKTLNSMRLCNVHDSAPAVLDLYITRTEDSDTRAFVGEDGNWNAIATTTFTYYILKNVKIPKGVTLVLDSKELSYDTTIYNLYIKLGAGDAVVDIIVNAERIQKNKSVSRQNLGSGSY